MSRFNRNVEKLVVSTVISGATRQAVLVLCITMGTFIPSPIFAQSEPANPTATFLVVRHAERDGNLDELTKAGVQRAQLLASLGNALNVQAIYSTNTQRTKGTVRPLATSVDTKIETYRRPSQDWIASVKQKHSGQVVLIVGHSNTTGVIAGLLANEKAYPIDHDEYDALFVVQVSSTETRSMRLQYGSSSEGAPSADPDKMGVLSPKQEGK